MFASVPEEAPHGPDNSAPSANVVFTTNEPRTATIGESLVKLDRADWNCGQKVLMVNLKSLSQLNFGSTVLLKQGISAL